MDKKRVQAFRRRIKKAVQSFSAFGEVLLITEMQAMSHDERVALRDALLNSRKPLSYDPLDKMILKEVA